MAEKILKEVREVYKTPRIEVRGVLLCDGIADVVSTDNNVSKNGWTEVEEPLRPVNNDMNDELWMVF